MMFELYENYTNQNKTMNGTKKRKPKIYWFAFIKYILTVN